MMKNINEVALRKKMQKNILTRLVGRFTDACKRRVVSLYTRLTAKHVSLPVGELFFQHNGQQDFLRYDMIVRLLAVECYFGKNDYGFDFYKRMQIGRTGKDWAEKAVDIFKDLIKSFEDKGYDTKSEILLDRNLHLIDGSHRIALAMYNHIDKINAKVVNQDMDVFYSIEWFYVNGFTKEECDILRSKYRELHAYYQQLFVCTLWHPARNCFDEITEKLKVFGNVVDVKDYSFNLWDYRFFTRGVYAVDDIEKWKIEKKIDYMVSCPSEEYKIRVVTLQLETPDFRLKATNNNTLSKRCETIKKVIRSYYKDKVENYFHDIIIHIGDNFYQNRHIYRLFAMPSIDVRGMLEHINGCNYVVTKSQSDYMPIDFPIRYPLGKDIDIICSDEVQYNKVKGILVHDAEKYKSSYRVRVVEKKDKDSFEYRTLLRIEQEDHLVFQFDIQCRTGSEVTPSFVNLLCKERVMVNGYYIPSPAYEIMIRICELHEYPHKSQHKAYISSHLSDINQALCDELLRFDWRNALSKELGQRNK